MLTTQIIDGKVLEREICEMNPNARQDIFTNIKYMRVSQYARETHIVLRLDGRIIGDVALEESPYTKGLIWGKHISIHKDFQGKGYSRLLLAGAQAWIMEHDYRFEPSSYTDMGEERVKPKIDAAMPQKRACAA